ncbi:MAG TPA: hypothetical protein VNO31_21965 [Umezawaea sp.]|nr:hypothetical protein [Umezawaea sp.]
MIEPAALFAEPTPIYELPPFPPQLVKDTANHDGLRYVEIGDDGEWVIILGHPTSEAVEAYARWQIKEWGNVPDEDYNVDDFTTTYARVLFACPDHAKDARDAECTWCRDLVPGQWWLDWGTGEDEGPLVNAHKPGYLPVTVWAVSS